MPGAASDVPDLALLLPSPGVPLTHPLIAAAKAADVPIRGDVDLFAELLGSRRVGRHHRHQRQVDHDRTGPASAGDRRQWTR